MPSILGDFNRALLQQVGLLALVVLVLIAVAVFAGVGILRIIKKS